MPPTPHILDVRRGQPGKDSAVMAHKSCRSPIGMWCFPGPQDQSTLLSVVGPNGVGPNSFKHKKNRGFDNFNARVLFIQASYIYTLQGIC